MTRKGWLGALATALLKVPQMRGLNMTLKPPRMTFFDCPSGLYEKPTRGPMLFLSPRASIQSQTSMAANPGGERSSGQAFAARPDFLVSWQPWPVRLA